MSYYNINEPILEVHVPCSSLLITVKSWPKWTAVCVVLSDKTRTPFNQCLTIFSIQRVKTYIITWRSKTLKAFSVCFVITITEQKKKVCWSKIKHNSFQWLEMKNMDLSRLYLIEKPEECPVKFLSSQKIDSVHVSILHPPCYRYIC